MSKDKKFALPDLTDEERRECMKLAQKEVYKEGIIRSNGRNDHGHSPAPNDRRETHIAKPTEPIKPEDYKEIPKRVAIQNYLESVGREGTFLELIGAMRAGGMKLHPNDREALRILGIIVTQNSGGERKDGQGNWPSRFYRVWKNEPYGDIDDRVGLLSWKPKNEIEPV